MKTRVRIAIALVAVVAMTLGIAQFANREPTYHGLRLRDWIREGFDGSPYRVETREAVFACGTNAIPFYLKLLQAKRDSTRKRQLLDFLEQHNWPKFGLVRESGPSAADAGAGALGILGAQARSAVPSLIKLVREGDVETAIHAGHALAYLGEGETEIRDMLLDSRHEKRLIAALIVGRYAESGELPVTLRFPVEIRKSANILVPALIPNLWDDPAIGALSSSALAVFARWSQIVVPALMENLQNPSNGVVARFACTSVLEDIGPDAKAAVPALFAILKETTNELHRAAGKALMQIDDAAGAEVVNRYARLIKDTTLKPAERNGMIEDLGSYGKKAAAAVPALIEIAKSDTLEVSDSATVALAAIDPGAAIKAGVRFERMFDPREPSKPGHEVAVIRALENLGKPSKESINCLLLALKRPDDYVRKDAGRALEKIAPEEAARAGIK